MAFSSFNIDSEYLKAIKHYRYSGIFPYSGGGGFDFLQKLVSNYRKLTMVSDIEDADFSPSLPCNCSDTGLLAGAIVVETDYSVCEQYGDYYEIVYTGNVRGALEYMANRETLSYTEKLFSMAREIGAYQSEQFAKNGEIGFGFSKAHEISGTEVINIFTSECGRFVFDFEKACKNYGVYFVLDWIRESVEHYGGDLD